jgi:hypothetical protein
MLALTSTLGDNFCMKSKREHFKVASQVIIQPHIKGTSKIKFKRRSATTILIKTGSWLDAKFNLSQHSALLKSMYTLSSCRRAQVPDHPFRLPGVSMRPPQAPPTSQGLHRRSLNIAMLYWSIHQHGRLSGGNQNNCMGQQPDPASSVAGHSRVQGTKASSDIVQREGSPHSPQPND